MADIPAIINDVAKAIDNACDPLMTDMIKNTLGTSCLSIAKHIIVPILAAELAFVGVRITLKKAFAEQFINFTVTSIIAFIILSGSPQQVIRNARDQLEDAGHFFAAEILQEIGSTADGTDQPIQWWGDWLGDVTKTSGKYNADYLFKMFDVPPLKDFFDATAYGGILTSVLDSTYLDKAKDLLKWAYNDLLPSISTFLKSAITVEGMMAMIMPLVFISMLLTAVMVQMAGYFAPLFVHVGILWGSRIMLEFALAVGIVVVPLMFLNSFKDIWQKYLLFSAGLALIPCFYYILAAIGFAFSTTIFSAICEPGEATVLFPSVLTQLFFTSLRDVVPSLVGWLGKGFLSLGFAMLWLFLAIFSKLFFFVGGSVIITAFVSGGVGFATIAPGVATAWNQAFNKMDMMEKITEFFSGIQSATGSAVGQTLTKSVSTGGGMASSLFKGLGRG